MPKREGKVIFAARRRHPCPRRRPRHRSWSRAPSVRARTRARCGRGFGPSPAERAPGARPPHIATGRSGAPVHTSPLKRPRRPRSARHRAMVLTPLPASPLPASPLKCRARTWARSGLRFGPACTPIRVRPGAPPRCLTGALRPARDRACGRLPGTIPGACPYSSRTKRLATLKHHGSTIEHHVAAPNSRAGRVGVTNTRRTIPSRLAGAGAP
jgi:hypothetical protein